MNFTNLTPHTIVLQDESGNRVAIEPSGKTARVATIETVIGEIGGMPVVSRQFGEVIGLDDVEMPVIVSAMVASAVPGREGVYAPDSGPTAIRENGQVVAVTRLVAA